MELRFILKSLLLPPGGLLLLVVLGCWLWLKVGRIRAGLACVLVGVLGLWVLSMPLTVQLLANWIEPSQALTQRQWRELPEHAQAIVVLGMGRELNDPGWGTDQPSVLGVERLRYAARLYRASALPVLISGGTPLARPPSEAQLMADVLREDFSVPVRWLEPNSRNTWENAQLSAQLLRQEGIERVLLVTHAWHMPRASWSFRQAGVEVVEAPVGFLSAQGEEPLGGVLPNAQAFWQNTLLLHEVIGSGLYRLRY